VDAQGAAAAFGQHGEIAAGLGGFYYAERIFLSRHRKIHFIVTGDLQEYAGIRAAFVGLAGGVEKTRAEAKNRGDFFASRTVWRMVSRAASFSSFMVR